jgi:polyhydroxybutyrate depolymerase
MRSEVRRLTVVLAGVVASSLGCGGGDDGAAPTRDLGLDASAVDSGAGDAGGADAGQDLGADATSSDAETPDLGDLDAGVGDATAGDAMAGDAGLGASPSAGCGAGRTTYGVGTTEGSIRHGGRDRTFRVRLPPGYDGTSPLPLVLMFHGGGGSGRQLEERSSRMNPVADRERFVVVYPDGSGAVRTWNAGGCCPPATSPPAVDDVGFVRALLDHLEAETCIDRRRVFASGMSNGALFSHRLACELADRIAAVAPVAGPEMSPTCAPGRPVPVMHIHGSDDGHAPWDGGVGCSLSGVSFRSVPETMERWRTRNGCGVAAARVLAEGDGVCDGYTGCAAGGETVLCRVEGGGHSWPGGEPPREIVDCPSDGRHSTTFHASEQIWRFFSRQARP